jgi:signal transduction histidine kinase
MLRRGDLNRDTSGRPIQIAAAETDTTGLMRDRDERRKVGHIAENTVEELTRLLSATQGALAREITQRERLEAMLRETETLAATGRMAVRMAHEINNPLAGIKNSLLLLKDAIPREHRYYEYSGLVEKEIDRIANIVRRMFDLYRRNAEPIRAFKPAEALGEIVSLLDFNARAHNIEIELNTTGAPAVVNLSESSFRQALFNIILNAIEASPAGGVVKIAANVLNDAIIITVADQGCGIPKEVRSHLFEAFYTTKSGSAQGGLGLGLSTSKTIIDSLGGHVDYVSEAGEGTIFKIIFPQRREASVEEF